MAAGINIMAGGEAGQGIQSIGGVLVKTLVRGGFNVFADQDYESRVRGGHNFYRIRTSEEEVHALNPALDLLIALNKETIDIHEKEMKPGGLIIYDKEQMKIDSPGANHFNVPFVRIAQETAGNKIMSNTVAVGVAMGLAEFDFNILAGVLEEEFKRHGEKIVQDNIKAARAGYEYAEEHCKECKFPRLPPHRADGKKMLISAHEALCLGALAAGCKFVAGYPMTPSSNILEFMADKGKEYGTVMIHVEDEIAAINMAIGAGFAGLRSMVATSGGGFSLMVEGLALAGMTETPVVIVLGQRPGPATGLPTRTEQGELLFAIHAGHGEFPRAVFAPKNAVDAFYIAIKAFNIAEKYQTPVIILTDQYLSSSYESIDKFDLSKVTIDRGQLLQGDEAGNGNYKRHLITPSGVSPRAIPGLGKALVVTDSDEHNEEGHIIEDAATRKAMVEKRWRKMEGLKKEVFPPVFQQHYLAHATLIGWGSTYGAIQEAAAMLNRDGFNVNTLHYNQLWPFPVEETINALDAAGKNIVIENNATSQLSALIKRETLHQIDKTVLKYDGRPYSPQEIYESVREEVA